MANTLVPTNSAFAILNRTIQSSIRRFGPFIALVLMFVVFTAVDSRFARPQNLQAILSNAVVPTIVSVGMTFVILQGSIDLSIEGVMGVSSLIISLLVLNSRTTSNLGFIAIPVGVCFGAIVGTLSGLIITKAKLPSFMVTLGIWSSCTGIAMLLAAGNPPLMQDMSIRHFALGYTIGIPNLTLVALTVVVGAVFIERFSKFGRYSYMIGSSEELVRLSGINVDLYKILAFMLCGALAALAGAVDAARVGIGSSDIDPGQMFSAITAVVIGGTSLAGGRGGIINTIVGVLILMVLVNGMIYVGVSPYMQQAVQGGIVLIAVLAASWHLRERMRVVK